MHFIKYQRDNGYVNIRLRIGVIYSYLGITFLIMWLSSRTLYFFKITPRPDFVFWIELL